MRRKQRHREREIAEGLQRDTARLPHCEPRKEVTCFLLTFFAASVADAGCCSVFIISLLLSGGRKPWRRRRRSREKRNFLKKFFVYVCDLRSDVDLQRLPGINNFPTSFIGFSAKTAKSRVFAINCADKRKCKTGKNPEVCFDLSLALIFAA